MPICQNGQQFDAPAARRGKQSILTAGFCFAALCLATYSSFAVELPKTAKLVPPWTVAVLEIDNYGRFKKHLDQTSFYKLYKDPQMAPFVENVKAKWQEKIKKIDENSVFRALLNADVEPQGRLGAAWLPDEKLSDANEPVPVFITQWGPDIAKIKEAVTKAIQKNTELGGHSKPSEVFRGVTIDSAVDEKNHSLSYCFTDDCFIFSPNAEGLKFVVAQITGATSPTLADDADYSAATQALGGSGDISLYVNIKQMVKAAAATDSQGRAAAALANLGLDNVAAMAMSAQFAPEPHKPYCIKALLKINGSKKGICRILDVESTPLRPPRFTPAESYRLTAINLDVKKAFNELASVLTAFGPALAAPLYNPLVPAGPDGEPAVRLKEDVIDHLGTQILMAQSMKKPFSENQFPAEYLVALATTNAGALEKSLAAWHDKMIAQNNPDAKRELLGHTIYLVRPQYLPFFRRGPQPMDTAPPTTDENEIPTFAFTFTDTHLLCGLESSVEKAVRTLRGGESISDTRWFGQARTLVPSAAGVFTLENTRAAAEFLWWVLQQSKKNPGAAGEAAPTASYMVSDMDLDFSLLPRFDTISRYFGLTGFYIVSRDDGFFAELKGLDQPPD
jgi:hypothetical protein